MQNNTKPPQFSLLLRVLGGGYLVYLAYDLLTSGGKLDTFVLVAAIAFGIIGAALLGISGYKLVTHDYFYDKPAQPSDEEEPETEE